MGVRLVILKIGALLSCSKVFVVTLVSSFPEISRGMTTFYDPKLYISPTFLNR